MNPGPLARFLPPLEGGVVSTWLADQARPGAWVLDPFGSAPRLALEAARAGYRVLVTANNPITRFMVEVAASAPRETDFKAALAELATSRKGDERLETHLQSLYLTDCSTCDSRVPAQAFLWRKGEEAPYGRIYDCKECGESGERMAVPSDAQRAAEIRRSAGLARARVLERVAPLDDPDREYAEEAIQQYLPRQVYALATLVNRLEGLQVAPERLRTLTALLLSACNAGSSLWPHPTERPRPKQLSVPPQFREQNVWIALEGAIKLWSEDHEPIPCLSWKESFEKGEKLPEAGGILLYEGRIRDLTEIVKDAPVQAVIGAIPRPNQAFWTLSALWAGWLWGREAAEPFKVALRRRRYDWNWQATALHAALHHVFELLPLGTPVFGLLAEADPGLLTAAMTAASTAGFDLRGLAMRTAHDPIQLAWKRGERLPREQQKLDIASMQETLRGHLRELGEPAPYLQLHAAGLIGQARGQALIRPEQDFDEALREVQSAVQEAVRSDHLLERQDDPERGLEVSLWDLKEGEARVEPLADRVEVAVVKYLQRNSPSTLLALERSLYPEFPGLLTPSKALVQAVLESYAIEENGRWQLRSEDQPPARRAELKKITELIDMIGKRLNYETKVLSDQTLGWYEGKTVQRVFYLLASSMTGRILAQNRYPVEKCTLVIPGGRAGLLAYKQNRDRRLKKRLESWLVVKFRLIRSLFEIPVLTRETFEEQIANDPVEQSMGQMMMF